MFIIPNTMNYHSSDSSASGSTASAVIPYRPWFFVLLSPGDADLVRMPPGMGKIDKWVDIL